MSKTNLPSSGSAKLSALEILQICFDALQERGEAPLGQYYTKIYSFVDDTHTMRGVEITWEPPQGVIDLVEPPKADERERFKVIQGGKPD